MIASIFQHPEEVRELEKQVMQIAKEKDAAGRIQDFERVRSSAICDSFKLNLRASAFANLFLELIFMYKFCLYMLLGLFVSCTRVGNMTCVSDDIC